ncbi:hypothetical protein MRAB57_3752 [Mycobacterium rhizamassiliense]|uniref:Low molecular weight antigen MTB12-like C-terminal domain-containing protein n=1 Tax=Mycobacterium rhizamassiliense TaxID=1841860 RepID=A0A2U3NWN2_9MYCO|nr:hypothetical protein [Mycobacterium rhizamassiliense]SPM35916.1 hypothetical protein MRAB57_3752 [Mycobacterium rhizamassiliense]
MPIKTLVGVAVAIGVAGAGMTSVAVVSPAAPARLVVLDLPLPLDPAADVPTVDQLLGVLNALQDPGVPFANKSYLVEGGISPVEARIADVRMKQAVARGEVPLTASLANIHAAGANSATVDVTISGPKVAPTTRNITFVDQGGWKITHASALALLQEAGGS